MYHQQICIETQEVRQGSCQKRPILKETCKSPSYMAPQQSSMKAVESLLFFLLRENVVARLTKLNIEGGTH